MRRGHALWVGVVVVVLLAGAAGWLAIDPSGATAEVATGRQVYAEHCASCHGANLEGQPNWRDPLPSGRMPAPPHDASGHTWHHADADLFSVVKGGLAAIVPGYESDMPAFAGVLTDEEIRAVLAFIKSSWPSRERTYQADRSAAAGEK